MGSFKLKLVLWFALLALLPLAFAFYGYDSLAKRSETRRTNVTLEAGLRVAVAAYAGRLDMAAARAEQLAAEPALQAALRKRDRHVLVRLLRGTPGAVAETGGLRVGALPSLAARRSVAVLERGRTLGRVVVSVPLDERLLADLGAGLPRQDRIVATRFGRVVAGSRDSSLLALAPGRPSSVSLGGSRYRGLRTATLVEPRGVALVALAPQSALDAAARSTELKLALALFVALLIFAAATYLLGRSIVQTLRRFASAAHGLAHGRLHERVEIRGRDEFARLGTAFNEMAAQLQSRLDELETERSRARDANVRFGAALAATHDPGQLVRIVVESAVEATGAVGGVVVGPEGELARAGDPDAVSQHIAFPLRLGGADFGSLVLSADAFDADQVEVAAALASQAVVALDNARLHRIVEHQALIDDLTGLANRRSLEDSLRSELARAQRFEDQVCFVLADLDDFKQVNDRHGHPAGDEALRVFAGALSETVREIDVAGRWGGEEFALVLPGTDADGGRRLAERAREGIERQRVRAEDGSELAVTASFGVASFPDCGDLGELIAAADSALYRAKREGKNRVVVAAESIAP